MNVLRTVPIQLSDQALIDVNTIPDRVQLLRTGKFYHKGSEVTVTSSDLEKMVFNFSEKVRGVDLMIDYSHNSEGEAAAWIDEIYLSENGQELWAKVIWTDPGKEAVLSKKYRYLSADFHPNFKNNETLAEYGPTLFGAGLTNRPVIKNMEPVIQLSEQKGSLKMLDAEMKKEIMAMIQEAVKGMKPSEDEGDAVMQAEKECLAEKEKQLSEKETELKEKEEKMVKEAEFNKMFSEGKVVEAQREAFLAGDIVKFSEAGAEIHGKNDGNNGADANNSTKDTRTAEEKIIELAEKKMEDGKTTLSEAFASVLRENKELNDEYQKKFN